MTHWLAIDRQHQAGQRKRDDGVHRQPIFSSVDPVVDKRLPVPLSEEFAKVC